LGELKYRETVAGATLARFATSTIPGAPFRERVRISGFSSISEQLTVPVNHKMKTFAFLFSLTNLLNSADRRSAVAERSGREYGIPESFWWRV
jgi:hypothetical protein